MKRKMWPYLFTNNGKRTCQQMQQLSTIQVDDPLSEEAAARLAEHLAECSDCRQWARQEELLSVRLHKEREPIRWLTPAAAAHNRTLIQQRLRRQTMINNTRQTIQGVVVLAFILILTAGFFIWWQQNDPPLLDTPATAPAAVTESEQVTLTLAVESSAVARYRSLIAAFEQENEEIRVWLVSLDEVADADETNLMRARATSFDVFPYSPNRQGDTQFLLDLRPLLALDPRFRCQRFPARPAAARLRAAVGRSHRRGLLPDLL